MFALDQKRPKLTIGKHDRFEHLNRLAAFEIQVRCLKADMYEQTP